MPLFVFSDTLPSTRCSRGKGKWADSLSGERAAILPSLGAKTALARQVFGGTPAD